MLEEKVFAKIKEYFLTNKNVAAVYLFGSTVKGRERNYSDIDLAVLFYPHLDKEERFSATLEIAVELTETTGTFGHKARFDVVDRCKMVERDVVIRIFTNLDCVWQL